MRYLKAAILAALAGCCAYFFVTRYWLHRDCIAAAQSSCVLDDGSNLTGGGMLWGIVALGLLAMALWSGVRAANKSRR